MSARQRAFLDAHASAFEGSPAACALGTHDDRLRVAFLAARQPCVAVENPRQVPAYRYPTDYGPRSPTFSRAALVDAGNGHVALLISGTASIVGHVTMHPGDVAAQVRETLLNLQALVEASAVHTDARFSLSGLQLTVYVRHAADAGTVHTALLAALGADTPAAQTLVLLQADICKGPTCWWRSMPTPWLREDGGHDPSSVDGDSGRPDIVRCGHKPTHTLRCPCRCGSWGSAPACWRCRITGVRTRPTSGPCRSAYAVYRGEWFKADRDGARAVLFDADAVELDPQCHGQRPDQQ